MTIITKGSFPRPIGPLTHRRVLFTAEPAANFGEAFPIEEGTLRMPVKKLPKNLRALLDLPQDYAVTIRVTDKFVTLPK